MMPHAAPNKKEIGVCWAIVKDTPIPTIERTSDVITMLLVDGKATRLTRL